jgi:hypothetical protein
LLVFNSFDCVIDVISFIVGTPASTITTGYTTPKSTGTTSACILSSWSSWSTCVPECQYDRYQQRTRLVVSGVCSEPLSQSNPCDKSPCEQCTITRESYTEALKQTPLSDGEFNNFFFRFNYFFFFFFFKVLLDIILIQRQLIQQINWFILMISLILIHLFLLIIVLNLCVNQKEYR